MCWNCELRFLKTRHVATYHEMFERVYFVIMSLHAILTNVSIELVHHARAHAGWGGMGTLLQRRHLSFEIACCQRNDDHDAYGV